jgi:hypothetical protein
VRDAADAVRCSGQLQALLVGRAAAAGLCPRAAHLTPAFPASPPACLLPHLQATLPTKTEYVLQLVPTPAQQELYQLYLQLCSREGQNNTLSKFATLKTLLNAPHHFELLMAEVQAVERSGQEARVGALARQAPRSPEPCAALHCSVARRAWMVRAVRILPGARGSERLPALLPLLQVEIGDGIEVVVSPSPAQRPRHPSLPGQPGGPGTAPPWGAGGAQPGILFGQGPSAAAGPSAAPAAPAAAAAAAAAAGPAPAPGGRKRGGKPKEVVRISATMAAALHERVRQLRQRAGGGDLWGSLPKQHLVMQLLQRCCVQAGERLVVFSEGLQPLEDLQQLVGAQLGWQLGREFLVLKGDTPARRRQQDIARFQVGGWVGGWVGVGGGEGACCGLPA